MIPLKLRHFVLALACQTVAFTVHGAEFKDPLERPSPAVGSLDNPVRMSAVSRADDRLVVVGPRGLVLLSDDGGKSWRQSHLPLRSDLVAVRFRSDKLGWAVGHDGVILHTADGGKTWAKQLDGFQAAERVQEHYDLAGAGGAALSEELRAELERMVADGADKPFLDVLFVSDTEGFAVGAFNLAMRTVDGGKTWTPIIEKTANPMGYHLYSLTMVGDDVYLAGERGLLRRWNRQAETFEVVETPYEGSYFGVLGKGANTLFAFGLQGTVFRSLDRGQTWKQLQGTGKASITGGAVLPDGRVALVNLGGKVLVTADDGETFKQLSGTRAMPYFGVAPTNGNEILVVGRNGEDNILIP